MSSSSSSSTSSFDSDEETDAQDLKPIRGYLSNRRELARQLFKSVKSEKIRMMLPQILKNMNLNDLEEWCASELCGMSEARILCILNGQTMLNSSDTSETDDSGPSLEIISDTEEWLTDTDLAIKEEPATSGMSGAAKRSKPTRSRNKAHVKKKNDLEKLRTKQRVARDGGTIAPIDANARVKREKKDKETRVGTNKEGESLLDLLELEMRARVIRALIRKEEDTVPSEATEKRLAMTASALRNTLDSAMSASLTEDKNLNGKLNHDGAGALSSVDAIGVEKLCRKTMETGEDEDVVFVVVKPTPTIELLSSESDNERESVKKRKNEEISQATTKKIDQDTCKSEEITEMCSIRDATTNERIVTFDRSIDGSDSLKIVVTKKISESSNATCSPGKSGKMRKNSGEKIDKSSSAAVVAAAAAAAKITASVESEKPTDKKNVDSSEAQSTKGLFKKIKRKQNLRTKRKIMEDTRIETTEKTAMSSVNPSVSVAEARNDEIIANASVSTEISMKTTIKLETPENVTEPTMRKEEKRAERGESSMRPIGVSVNDDNDENNEDDDRLDDFEVIIDLDDYPDDMDEMDNNAEMKKIKNNETLICRAATSERKVPKITNETIIIASEAAESSETWASRYYQTDDVQNVIKESKIQSEIRKRLRERQRLSKLGGSPKRLGSPVDADGVAAVKSEEKMAPKPTGSVQEYLALKNLTNISGSESAADNIVTGDTRSPEVSTENITDARPEVATKDENSVSTNEPAIVIRSTENTSNDASVPVITESATKVQ